MIDLENDLSVTYSCLKTTRTCSMGNCFRLPIDHRCALLDIIDSVANMGSLRFVNLKLKIGGRARACMCSDGRLTTAWEAPRHMRRELRIYIVSLELDGFGVRRLCWKNQTTCIDLIMEKWFLQWLEDKSYICHSLVLKFYRGYNFFYTLQHSLPDLYTTPNFKSNFCH